MSKCSGKRGCLLISFGPMVDTLEMERCAAPFFYSIGERGDDV